MRTVFLHIGHDKTGSSWIQSSLRASGPELEAEGIVYPLLHRDDALLAPEAITAGNATNLTRSAGRVRRRIARAAVPGRSLLFSSETMFRDVCDGRALEFVQDAARRHRFDRIAVLLFIRDPIGHAASRWQQAVKREGHVGDADAFGLNYPAMVAGLLERIASIGDADLTVRNYSRGENRLLIEVEDWLGVAPATLRAPPLARINRSLTHAELALQRALNRRLGACGDLLSDPLCERLPDVQADEIRPSLAAQQALWERVLPDVLRANARLPEAHRYRKDVRAGAPSPDALVLSHEQIEVIADALAEGIARTRGRGLGWGEGARRLIRSLGRGPGWDLGRSLGRVLGLHAGPKVNASGGEKRATNDLRRRHDASSGGDDATAPAPPEGAGVSGSAGANASQPRSPSR